jgi:hypothetical protein
VAFPVRVRWNRRSVGSQARRAYISHWNVDAEPFIWTATADEILAKVALTQTNVRKLVANNQK